jgi:hypothetical protein
MHLTGQQSRLARNSRHIRDERLMNATHLEAPELGSAALGWAEAYQVPGSRRCAGFTRSHLGPLNQYKGVRYPFDATLRPPQKHH